MEFGIAKKEDVADILVLYKQLNASNSDFSIADAHKIWDKIEKENIRYFVAKDAGRVAGCCYIAIIPNLTFNGKAIGYIENVVIDAEHRRQGIGREILKRAVDYAKEQNCYKVVLQSGSERKDAHKFYQSIGFDGNSKKAFQIRLDTTEEE
ncbi:MAG: GNAT family N-acetyltransferase [Spirochaetaceae bacterium]|jgi:GNAT superfamily N-acetyltransferase|nr:GNAT family N-acetyltransferase [Spirochaetaceae bacterium]